MFANFTSTADFIANATVGTIGAIFLLYLVAKFWDSPTGRRWTAEMEKEEAEKKRKKELKKKKQEQTNDNINNSNLYYSGTAFFVDNVGHLITNYHVVSSCKKNPKIIYKNKDIDAKILAHDEKLDLALLKINSNNKNFISLSDNNAKKMQSIIAAGFPHGKEFNDDLQLTSGHVSSLKGFRNSTALLQIDAALNQGNSGGPIVDKKSGELLAVAVAGLRKDMSEGINYGIKSSQLKDFLESNKIKLKKSNSQKDVVESLENSTVYIHCQ